MVCQEAPQLRRKALTTEPQKRCRMAARAQSLHHVSGKAIWRQLLVTRLRISEALAHVSVQAALVTQSYGQQQLAHIVQQRMTVMGSSQTLQRPHQRALQRQRGSLTACGCRQHARGTAAQ